MIVSLGDRSYNIEIGHGILDTIGRELKKTADGGRVFVITDDVVEALYADPVVESLAGAGFEPHVLSFPNGEQSKTTDTLTGLVRRMLELGITRSDRVLALGGGVVGDTAGFAAHIVLRGVPYVQVPTTLLAQVDSSVGGKVAVDVPEGKNLVGAFHQPALVLIDTDCLNTLTDEIFSDGMAEVLKYGLISDAHLFDRLVQAGGRGGVMREIASVVERCVDLKRIVVEEDELDTGGRMILNFGHTLGHVIEKQYHYETYTHGQAVAAGMVAASALGERMGVTAQGTEQRVRDAVRLYGLPEQVPVNRESLESVKLDKKNTRAGLNVILLREVGKCLIQRMDADEYVSQMDAVISKNS